MNQLINLEIDVTKFLKEEFIRRPGGIFAKVTIFLNEERDGDGRQGTVFQDRGHHQQNQFIGEVHRVIDYRPRSGKTLAEKMNEQAMEAQRQVRGGGPPSGLHGDNIDF